VYIYCVAYVAEAFIMSRVQRRCFIQRWKCEMWQKRWLLRHLW